jgi:hypothetical protein
MHRHSLLLSRPLSVCLKIRDLVDKIEPKHIKRAVQHTYSPATNHSALHQKHSPNHALSLQEDYDSRLPVEPPTTPDLILEHRYPHLRALRTDAETGDGLWLCCACQHLNILTHYHGLFPFKHLTCARCSSILCPGCLTSEIISPLPWGMVRALAAPEGKEVRYLHVCTTCGLSHRAEMVGETLDFYGVTCRGCGTSSFGDWPRWCVGSVEPYRRDPDLSYVRLVEMRAERAVVLAARAELGCRNPD